MFCLLSLSFAKETNLTQSSQYVLAQEPVVHPPPLLYPFAEERGGTTESKHTVLQEAHAGIAARLRISAATGAINGRATMSWSSDWSEDQGLEDGLDLPFNLVLHLPLFYPSSSDCRAKHVSVRPEPKEGELLPIYSTIVSRHPETLTWKKLSLLFVVHSQVCKILSPLAIDIVFETLEEGRRKTKLNEFPSCST